MFEGHYLKWEGSDYAHIMVSPEKTRLLIYSDEQGLTPESAADSVALAL
jgi:hypothetical protein